MIRLLQIITLAMAAIASWFITTEWHPHDIEEAALSPRTQTSQPTQLPVQLEVVSWNIGYAGLGEDMDFFYDGGERTRCSKAQTLQNLDAIISQLKTFAQTADVILLQEVDEDSHRTYGINMRDSIAKALPEFHHAWAYNYRSKYIPIPLSDPMGRVNSGIMTLSRHPVARAVRYQYPSVPSLPSRLFLLKRAMLSIAIPTPTGDTLWINNTHNSAFDNGEGRRKEIAHIGKIIENQTLSITAGDWNSTPPHYIASEAALSNDYFRPITLSHNDLPSNIEFVVDFTKPTMRYLDRTYNPELSTVCNIDFGIIKKPLHTLNCTIIDLHFKNSDHNPIIFLFYSTDNQIQ